MKIEFWCEIDKKYFYNSKSFKIEKYYIRNLKCDWITVKLLFVEMSEFSTNGHRAGGSTSGTYNKNGGLKAVTPPQYAYGNGGYPHANPNGNQVVPSVSSL